MVMGSEKNMKDKLNSYEERLTEKLNSNNKKNREKRRKKTKRNIGNILRKIGFFLVGLLILGLLKYYIQFSSPTFFYVKNIQKYTKANVNYIFKNINFSNNNIYQIGFNYGKSEFIKKNRMKLKNDANYTIEYYNQKKLLRVKHYNKNYRHLTFSSQNNYYWTVLDQIKVPKDIRADELTIKLIVHKPFSFWDRLKETNQTVDFYIDKLSRDIVEIFEKSNSCPKSNKIPIYKIKFEPYDINRSKVPILKALFAKNTQKVKEIIEVDNGIDVHSLLENKNVDIIRDRRTKARTPIIYASYFNDIDTLQYLIAKGADLEYKDYISQNALGYAIYNNSIEAVKLLLKAGAKLDKVDYVATKTTQIQYITSPLTASVANNYYEMVKLLLENGAKNKFPSNRINYSVRDIYSYIYYIDDYKRILTLLLDYNISSPTLVKIYKKYIKETYYGCTKGDTLDEICTPITKRKLKEEDMDIYIYFEISYLSRIRRNKKN